MKIKTPHPFLATEIKVYPTAKSEQAREVEVPPQTAKHAAITRAQLEEQKKRGRHEG